MIRKAIYNRKIKELFSRIGVEKASPDFTNSVMGRIQREPAYVRVRKKPLTPYYLAAIFIAATCLSLPFGNYLVNITNELIFRISAIDYSFIERFIDSLIDTIGGYYISSTVIIIAGLSTLFFCIMMIINFRSSFQKKLQIYPV